MTVKDYVGAYALSHDLAPATIEQLGFAVKALDKWLERSALLAELSDDLLNRWITARLAQGKSRRTVRGQRGAILTLWRAAHDDGLVENPPRRVKIVKTPSLMPEAWWEYQLRALLTAADKAPGRFKCGLKRGPFLRAWILVGYYSLFRACDLRKLEWSSVGDDGTVLILQEKTGWPVLRHLPPDAMAALEGIRSKSTTIFPVSKKTLSYWWRWLKKESGVPGTLKWLRRSGATACEVQQPGSAMAALGHKTPGLAFKHYVDQRQLQQRPPTPPRIA